MREFVVVLLGTFSIGLFCATMIYPNLEYTGHKSNRSCIDQCYVDYVREYGTVVDIERDKQQLSNKDEFSSIRSLWKGCSSCHGSEGEGMSVFPKLSGRTSDYISNRLYSYKNRETVGNMSQTMWGQAGMLSSQQIETLSKYIEKEL